MANLPSKWFRRAYKKGNLKFIKRISTTKRLDVSNFLVEISNNNKRNKAPPIFPLETCHLGALCVAEWWEAKSTSKTTRERESCLAVISTYVYCIGQCQTSSSPLQLFRWEKKENTPTQQGKNCLTFLHCNLIFSSLFFSILGFSFLLNRNRQSDSSNKLSSTCVEIPVDVHYVQLRPNFREFIDVHTHTLNRIESLFIAQPPYLYVPVFNTVNTKAYSWDLLSQPSFRLPPQSRTCPIPTTDK